jgi:hypothetical protein
MARAWSVAHHVIRPTTLVFVRLLRKKVIKSSMTPGSAGRVRGIIGAGAAASLGELMAIL